jgi:hypothetical protein
MQLDIKNYINNTYLVGGVECLNASVKTNERLLVAGGAGEVSNADGVAWERIISEFRVWG